MKGLCIYLLLVVLFTPGLCFAQPAWVRDGLGPGDAEWTKLDTELSAHWAEVIDAKEEVIDAKEYEYAIGTTEGGTDILNWGESPIVYGTSTTHKGLNLTHGTRYYFSVRQYTFAKPPPSKSSNGITVDIVPPTSQVNSIPPAQTSLSFMVSWSGSDALSGMRHYDVQYRDGEEGIWLDWLSTTTLTSSIFTGENGHTYYFRCRAQDNAGNQESYPITPDTYTRIDIDIAAPTLSLIPSPTNVIFHRDVEFRNVTYTLSLIGPVGVRINQERVTYEQDGRVIRRETPIISEYISAGRSIRLSRTITLDDTLRSLILRGRPTARFTLRRQFSGFDDRANPVSAEAIINVEVRTTQSEVFEVTGVEIILPEGIPQGEEITGRIRFSTSGPPGSVRGSIYYNHRGLRNFEVSGIEDQDEILTPQLPTSIAGTHTLSVLLTRPNRIEATATYEVFELRELRGEFPARPDITGVDFVGTRIRPDITGVDFIGSRIRPDVTGVDFVGARIRPDITGVDFIGSRIRPDVTGVDFIGSPSR